MGRGLLTIEELGRRAVACARWRWLPGMLVRYRTGYHERIEDDTDAAARLEDDGLPDLDDPATRGALLALVRAAYDDERAHVRPAAGGWDFYTLDPMAPRVTAPTEAQCLVAALDAAP